MPKIMVRRGCVPPMRWMRSVISFLSDPFGSGITTAIAAWVLISWLLGPVKCSDGWASPSIGSRGACSWHGGVDHSHGFIALFGAAFAGFLVAQIVQIPRQKKIRLDQQKWEQDRKAAIRAAGLECPDCGAAMVRRLARNGKNRGRYFVGCTRYPLCKNARDLTQAEILTWGDRPTPRHR